MSLTNRSRAVALIMLLSLALGELVGAGGMSTLYAAPRRKLPPIYDTKVDGGKQIAEALVLAKRDHKRVLLQFGANWCSWCHRLHKLFSSDRSIAAALNAEYELVLIDIDKVAGKTHNAEIVSRYGQPTKHGLPVFVVLDANGKQLTTRETASWEVGESYDPAKVLAFLKKWQPPRVSAREALSAALARAKSSGKRTFLWFGAPWCSYCKLMTGYLHNDEVKRVFDTAYVHLKIDVDRMTGGKELAKRHGLADSDGLPFFVILDSDGQRIANSRRPEGNVGFPVEPYEIDGFMTVIRKTAGNLTTKQLALLEAGLKRLRPKGSTGS